MILDTGQYCLFMFTLNWRQTLNRCIFCTPQASESIVWTCSFVFDISHSSIVFWLNWPIEIVSIVKFSIYFGSESAFNLKLKMIQCTFCRKLFRKDNLKRHIDSVHNKLKFNCVKCGISCSTKGALTRHMLTSRTCKPAADVLPSAKTGEKHEI